MKHGMVPNQKSVPFAFEDSMPGIQKESPSKCVELKVDEGADFEQADVQNSLNKETDSVAETEHTS